MLWAGAVCSFMQLRASMSPESTGGAETESQSVWQSRCMVWHQSTGLKMTPPPPILFEEQWNWEERNIPVLRQHSCWADRKTFAGLTTLWGHGSTSQKELPQLWACLPFGQFSCSKSNEKTKKWMNEQSKKVTNDKIKERTNKEVNRCMNKQMNDWVNERMNDCEHLRSAEFRVDQLVAPD